MYKTKLWRYVIGVFGQRFLYGNDIILSTESYFAEDYLTTPTDYLING